MRSEVKLLFSALVIVLALTTVTSAQEITGTIVGTVKDPSGAVVPNATITVLNTDTNVVVRTLETGSTGDYVAALLPIGHYTISATASGFKKTVQTAINLNVNDRLTYNLVMQVGSTDTEVTVAADALQVEQQSATAAGLINGTQVRELSLNNRNYEQLVVLQPGVSYGGGDQLYVGVMNPNGDDNSVSFSINGARDNANNWTIDGSDNVDRGSNSTLLNYPSVDSIAEFKVLRGMYNAEFGRSMGGQINVITKSGQSKFHGSAYEFFRNDVLNANNYFNKNWEPTADSPWVERPPLRYNDFGYTIGGPIYIPGKYNTERNKTFFFFSQEFRRINMSATSYPGIVPTAQEKQGIFANPVCVAFDIDGNCTATGNQITNIDPVAKAYVDDLFSKIQNPQNPAEHILISPLMNIYNYRQELVKIDHNFNQKLTASFRFINDDIPTEEPTGLWTGMNVPGVATTSTNAPGRNYLGRVTYSITPTFLMEAGYSHSFGAIFSTPIGLLSSKVSPHVMPLINYPSGSEVTVGRIPSLSFTGGDYWGGFGAYDDQNKNDNWFGNFTKITGHHTIKFGFSFNTYNKYENAAGDNAGGYDISATGVPDGTSEFEQSWANFLMGRVSRFYMASKDSVADIHQNQLDFYLQDEFRLRPNLTLSYGVRYSLYRQPTDGAGRLVNFDPHLYDPNKAPVLDDQGNIISGEGQNPSYDWLNGIIIGGNDPTYGHKSPWGTAVASQSTKNFAPRFGFAWDPFSNGKTSVRGGYGVFFDSPTVGFVEDNIFANVPYVYSMSYNNTTLQNPAGGTQEISSAPPYLRVNGVNWHLPYTQQWSFDVQHQFGGDMMIDIGYYGNKGTHLLGGIDVNQVRPGVALAAGLIGPDGLYPDGIPSDNTSVLNAYRPYVGYGVMNSVEPMFKSSYHSLQASFEKRFKGNSLINASYTWSKTMTDNPGDRWTAPQSSYDLLNNYGPSDLDRPHIFTASFVYDLPFMTAQKGAAGKILGGWALSGVIVANSGTPFTVGTNSSVDPSGQGILAGGWESLNPDQIANPNNGAPQTQQQWFNTAAFVDIPAGQYRPGTERRNAVRGPGFSRWDLGLFKNFKITESTGLQFRLETFNTWNHTNWASVGSTLGDEETYGKITSARDPRNVQLALKFTF